MWLIDQRFSRNFQNSILLVFLVMEQKSNADNFIETRTGSSFFFKRGFFQTPYTKMILFKTSYTLSPISLEYFLKIWTIPLDWFWFYSDNRGFCSFWNINTWNAYRVSMFLKRTEPTVIAIKSKPIKCYSSYFQKIF